MSKYVVTDHAVLRYIERVMEFDLSIVRQSIISKENKNKINAFGGTCVIPIDGCEAIFKDYRCITVVKKNTKGIK